MGFGLGVSGLGPSHMACSIFSRERGGGAHPPNQRGLGRACDGVQRSNGVTRHMCRPSHLTSTVPTEWDEPNHVRHLFLVAFLLLLVRHLLLVAWHLLLLKDELPLDPQTEPRLRCRPLFSVRVAPRAGPQSAMARCRWDTATLKPKKTFKGHKKAARQVPLFFATALQGRRWTCHHHPGEDGGWMNPIKPMTGIYIYG